MTVAHEACIHFAPENWVLWQLNDVVPMESCM